MSAEGASQRLAQPHATLSRRKNADEERSAGSNPKADIRRAEAAYQLMQVADLCLKIGADHLLLQLGFSQQHITALRNRAGPGGGYPAYALRNIHQTLRMLRHARDEHDQSAQEDNLMGSGTK